MTCFNVKVLSINPTINKPSFGAKLTVLGVYTPIPGKVCSASDLKLQAEDCMNKGLYDKAITLYNQALTEDPDDIKLHLSLAKTYSYNNQFKEAIPHLEKFVAQNSDDIENMTFLGECYKKSGMFSQAISRFEKALSVEPAYDYAKRNLLDAKNLLLQCSDPQRARQERFDASIKNLTDAVKEAKNFYPKNFTKDLKDLTVTFDKTAKMGGRANIAQYEHSKRKISVTDDYTYASPKLTGAYLVHEFTHAKDNDPYTSVCEEQDAYRAQAEYWIKNVKNVADPEMDYVGEMYKNSAKDLDNRVAEIYRLRDPGIPDTSYNHPPSAKVAARGISTAADQPLKAYDIIV